MIEYVTESIFRMGGLPTHNILCVGSFLLSDFEVKVGEWNQKWGEKTILTLFYLKNGELWSKMGIIKWSGVSVCSIVC